ncbi:MAG: hypothetical protein KGL39_27045 [Patescibacteria group bacterium]|nr:hypothetical protein [Patescibacteria group bacterium]
MATKIYENTTNKPIEIVGLGTVAPHDRLTEVGEYLTPVNLANYPGLIDVLADEAENGPAPSPEDRAAAAKEAKAAKAKPEEAQEQASE